MKPQKATYRTQIRLICSQSCRFYLTFYAFQDAEEYAELPVRHNEDQLNSQLAQQLPLQVNPHSFDSAHTKTHLLLQAHFSHAQLPCSDYNTDTKTVLDNAIRICQVGTQLSLLRILFGFYTAVKLLVKLIFKI